ncbi:hypothetical protein PanWU01x14_284490 [Parasponia andersonii]|uniref:Uncharacterized protein n=1 Tax=Parasponia andersonii TaxID=3476 RepID=A0A2P5B015_PARAD|nr:hypothetical protein PanWU01x14_284490 [Parasponia andersonii]
MRQGVALLMQGQGSRGGRSQRPHEPPSSFFWVHPPSSTRGTEVVRTQTPTLCDTQLPVVVFPSQSQVSASEIEALYKLFERIIKAVIDNGLNVKLPLGCNYSIGPNTHLQPLKLGLVLGIHDLLHDIDSGKLFIMPLRSARVPMILEMRCSSVRRAGWDWSSSKLQTSCVFYSGSSYE